MNRLLTKILDNKKAEVSFCKSVLPLKEIRQRAADAEPARDFAGSIKSSAAKHRVIAEVKRISPGAGFCRKAFDPAEIAKGYEAAGAAALSLLTDTVYFGGSAHCLALAKSVVNLPVLRKDFIIDAYQVYESKAVGADALLLMAVNFDSKNQIEELAGIAGEIGLEVLFEVHDENDLNLIPGSVCVGINNRDFHDDNLKVETAVTLRLAPMIKGAKLLVSESGIRDTATMEEMEKAGVNAFLIGTALMMEEDPGKELARLLSA